MKISKFALFFAVGCVLTSGAVRDAAAEGKQVRVTIPMAHYSLPNGLEVVLQEDHASPLVALNLRYHAGSKDDPEGKSGLAHLVEHLMFTGTRDIEKDGVFREFDRIPAEGVNANTRKDLTEYVEQFPVAHLGGALWIEAERMVYGLDKVDAALLARERNVVLNEMRERYKAAANGSIWETMFASIYPATHPYARQAIGNQKDLESVTVADAQSFYTRYYAPNNATLVLVGDFKTVDAKRLVETYFGGVSKVAPKRPVRQVPALVAPAKRKVWVEADVAKPKVYVVWPMPPPLSRESEIARRTFSYMADYTRGRLNETKKSSDVDSTYDPGRLGSLGILSVEAESAADFDEISADIGFSTTKIQSVYGLSGQGWGNRAARRIINQVLELSTFPDRAEQLQTFIEYAGTPDYVNQELHSISEVEKESVRDYADHFGLDRGILIYVTPNAAAPINGKVVRSQ